MRFSIVILLISVSCVTSTLMKLKVNGVSYYNAINQLFPKEGSPITLEYEFVDMDIKYITIERLKYDYDEVLIHNTGKINITKSADFPKTMEFNYITNRMLQIKLGEFRRECNGTYVLTAYLKNSLFVINYFILNYRKFVEFNAISINTVKGEKHIEYNNSVSSIDVDQSKNTTIGLVYRVWGLEFNHKINLYVNGFDITSLFMRIETILNKTVKNDYFERSSMFYILDTFKASECIFTRPMSIFRMTLIEKVGLEIKLAKNYIINLKGKSTSQCDHSTTTKSNGVYKANVLRCVHYIRGEYLHSSALGELSINFYVKEGAIWKGLSYFIKSGINTKEVVKEGADIFHGEFWSDLVFPAATKSEGFKYKCEVFVNKRRIITKHLKSEYIEGDINSRYYIGTTSRNATMNSFRERLSVSAFKNAIGVGPTVAGLVIFGILLTIMITQKEPERYDSRQQGESKSAMDTMASYKNEESALSDKGDKSELPK